MSAGDTQPPTTTKTAAARLLARHTALSQRTTTMVVFARTPCSRAHRATARCGADCLPFCLPACLQLVRNAARALFTAVVFLEYMLMLVVMTFNLGLIICATLGFCLGALLFGERVCCTT